MFPVRDVERAFDIDAYNDTVMNRNIELWSQMYQDQSPWVINSNGLIQSAALPSAIANEIARLVTLELKSEVTGDSERAKYLQEQYKPVIESIRKYCEYACAKGGLIMKTYVDTGKLRVDYVQADSFYPVKFGSNGDITAAVFSDQRQVGDYVYTRLEYHDFNGSSEAIRNRAYKSKDASSLGSQVSLDSVEEWKDIAEEIVVNNIDKPLFVYFRIPSANNVDTSSPLGVSVFSRAVDLIREADKQYSRILWEFESAERAVDIDVSAVRKDEYGNDKVPQGKERLFRKFDMDGKNGDSFYEVFSPDIRDESHQRGFSNQLRLIEFNCGLAYGTLSDPSEVAKTATEMKQSKQRSYATVSDIQKSLEASLRHLIYIMNVYTTLYGLAPQGEYDVSYVWDDSIVVDAEAERLRDLQEMRDGVLSKWEYRAKWYGEDEETAKAKIQEAKNESQTDDEILGFNGGGA